MDRQVRELMVVRRLLLLAVLPLHGCITDALWYEDVVPPELLSVSVPCEALEVTRSADADDPSIVVGFAAQPTPGAPPHLTRFHSDRPGVFELRPQTAGEDWRQVPGAELFAPSAWDLRITSGTHFRAAVTNAELEFRGVVQPGDLGELVSPEQLPEELREPDSEMRQELATLWQARCLEAFESQAWLELLSPTDPSTGYRQVPLAWVDGDLNVLEAIDLPKPESVSDNEEVRARLRGLRLLARLDDGSGNQHYALIGVPVLLQGTELRLRREGSVVRWSRPQTWTARLHAQAPDAEARIPFSVPLRGQSFDYRWYTELGQGEPLLDALRVLATPITAALDFAIMTNEPLSNLARFLSGQEQTIPFRPTTDR